MIAWRKGSFCLFRIQSALHEKKVMLGPLGFLYALSPPSFVIVSALLFKKKKIIKNPNGDNQGSIDTKSWSNHIEKWPLALTNIE